MRRAFFFMTALLAISACAFGQAASSDTQTLQALLSEVRALRQDLRVSLNRTQGIQILLARLQLQEGAVTRASDHLNDARQKLFETHVRQRELSSELKRTEEALNTADNPADNPQDLQDRIKHIKSDLEIAGNIAQQQQTTETQAEQQLRDEQDKLSVIEGQLDELIRTMGSTAETSGRNRP
jgi:DNA repair exonuclease SbcCD ATPase subunit